MNTLLRKIEACMSSFASDGHGDISANFSFPADFAGFQGHFPGNPVLPAVCILQAIMLMAGKHAGTKVELKTISSAKWFAPTGTDSTLRFTLNITPTGTGDATIKARISHGTNKIADVKLLVNGIVAREGRQP